MKTTFVIVRTTNGEQHQFILYDNHGGVQITDKRLAVTHFQGSTQIEQGWPLHQISSYTISVDKQEER